ncbi:MAG: serine--tRNA ligase [Bdellovibrionales bacterium]|jgi:seryl-tRNA synthetase|nr:serine--tRNA ligase [Bdellovibrionales bacterium]MBT7669345.1 serine--tRNA ligase [Bdellovibrionales bacterium]
MLDIKTIVEKHSAVVENLKRRNFNTDVIDQLVSLNTTRKELITEVEGMRAEVKKLSKEIGPLKKKKEDASKLMEQVATIKRSMEGKDKELEDIQTEQNSLLMVIPNLLAEDVPTGSDESENHELASWGEPRRFDFTPKDHVQLGEELQLLDFEAGAKLSGSRFVVYRGALAKMERALINFMIDHLNEHSYEEIIPPFIVHKRCLEGTGQLPKFKEDLFKLENSDWYLIPTAEVPLTNLKREELFLEQELPLKYCASTPCFRSEAGSYGKDTRGLIRLHQFNKVEMVNIVRSENSEEAHEEMINIACSVLEKLNIPYKKQLLCSGDTGFGARRCIDLEVWLPGQQKYREISSISNCGDFQARRAGIRYRNSERKPVFAHTLNGSGLAVGRTLVAILENYQQGDGSIIIPEVLQSYMGGMKQISKKKLSSPKQSD